MVSRLAEEKERYMTVNRDIYKKGHLTARPDDAQVLEVGTTGVRPLNLGGKRDGFIYVPKGYQKSRPPSLALMLHGAGGHPEHGLSYLRDYADEKNIIMVAPASRASSWDIISDKSFDRDVIFIDQVLAQVFGSYAIDPSRLGIGGFSDGASYALCIGLSNGDLFTHILAFSPGFVYTVERKGKPAVFVSHGTEDGVLPIGFCSRRIVPKLQDQGYQVNFQEFEAAHEVPDFIAKSGAEWLSNHPMK